MAGDSTGMSACPWADAGQPQEVTSDRENQAWAARWWHEDEGDTFSVCLEPMGWPRAAAGCEHVQEGVFAFGTGIATGDRVPVPPLTSCGALGKLHSSSALHFLVGKAGIIAACSSEGYW